MQSRTLRHLLGSLLVGALTASAGQACDEGAKFDVLYTFEVADPATSTSALGSQPDTRPVLGRDHSLYGMTYTGGTNGTGVIYKYEQSSKRYVVLHEFGALDADGNNADGAYPGVALTEGPDGVFFGMASNGGAQGAGTIFKVSATGDFKVLHTFSAVDANLHNHGGANPLRALVFDAEGNLYGTTRLGGDYTCGPKSSGCGVAWKITPAGLFTVVHEFTPEEGHAASLLLARDGNFYGCAVYPFAAAGSGILYRMRPSGAHFEVLHEFTAVDASGNNVDGANCYEPLVEAAPGVFFGAASGAGPQGSGVVFRYATENGGTYSVVHAFTALDASGDNEDGADPYARLTRGADDWLYSTASAGGQFGNGVVYRVRSDGKFELLHTFSAINAATGANVDGATPDYGVLLEGDATLIGMSDYGGAGSSAGATGNGTLYKIELRH
jgi:uncharacterized repeat protein (TIGR03803 family)